MLSAIDVVVYPPNDCELPHPSGHLVREAILDLVGLENPMMAEMLRNEAEVKPYAFSTLRPRSGIKDDRLYIRKNTGCRFRVCALTRAVFDVFSNIIFSLLATNGSITIGGENFRIADAIMEPPAGGAVLYDEIHIDRAGSVTLKFASPVVIDSERSNVLMPDPKLLYQDLWRRWNMFAPAPVGADVFAEMRLALAVENAYIRTRIWKYPDFDIAGFIGSARFSLIKRVPPEAKALFSALSSFSLFSGIGCGTDIGMGQCWRERAAAAFR